jgi:hypothetical protein
MSYEELKKYLELLHTRTGFFEVRIDWSAIKPDQIEAYPPGRRMGLQIADAVAGSFFYAVQPSQHGFTENRYARILKPVVYHRQGQYQGYGIKFWPREVDEMVKSEERLAWVQEAYK